MQMRQSGLENLSVVPRRINFVQWCGLPFEDFSEEIPLTVLVQKLFVVFFGGFLAILLNVCQGFADESPVLSEVIPLERRPYEVRLLVALDSSFLDASASQSIVHEVDQAANRCVGKLWHLKSSLIGWLGAVGPRGLQRLDRSFLSKNYSDEVADVWFVACVESTPAAFRVSMRSWQPELELETALQTVELHDRREIPITILRLCRDLFRPMGVVEQSSKQSAIIRLRAGELTPLDPSFTQLKADDLMLPVLAYRGKNKVVERLQPIPWTYVSVGEMNGAMVNGKVHSGLKMGLGGKKRGRIDTFVVLLRPEYASTQIELLTQKKPQLPLVAHRIEVRTSYVMPTAAMSENEEKPDSTLLNEMLTDRRGLSRVNIQPNHPLVWLFAYSGEHLLTRVPFVPGHSLKLRFDVPDDSARLMAEGDLQMLQGEVIDAVALRNTAIASIRAAAKKDEWAFVNQKLNLLKQQQESAFLKDRLVSVRVAGTAAAKAKKDRSGEIRINRICDDMGILIDSHLGSEKIRLLNEEMEILQKVDHTEDKTKSNQNSFEASPAKTPPVESN